jgi:hypothetical protein
MLENIPSDLENRPLSSGPLFQWLGVQWQDKHYAISLNHISAVFKTSPSIPSAGSNFNLDVAVHDGGVVFMKAFEACFDIPDSTETHPPSTMPQWSIVLHSALAANIGCRVQSVVGPFWAKSGLAFIEHESQQWAVVQRCGEAHA